MRYRAKLILVAAVLSGGATLIVATLKSQGWSSEHGLRWNLLALWRYSRDDMLVSIATVAAMILAVLAFVVSQIVYARVREGRN